MTTPEIISNIKIKIGKSFNFPTAKNTAARFKKDYGIELQGAPLVVKCDNGRQSLIFCLYTGYSNHPKPMKTRAEYLPFCDTSDIPAKTLEKIQEATFNPFKY